MKVKVCGMTIPTNLRTLSQLAVDYVGFIFYDGSKRNVTAEPEAFREFYDSQDRLLTDKRIKKVGVFVNSPWREVLEKVEKYQLDLVQLHGDENIFYCSKLHGKKIKIIKAFSVDENFIFTQTNAYQYYCDYFLFDTKGSQRGGNGIVFDWRILQRYKGRTPFFLSGGITAEMAKSIKALNFPMLHAVDINSGFEIEPGYKDIDRISWFLGEMKG